MTENDEIEIFIKASIVMVGIGILLMSEYTSEYMTETKDIKKLKWIVRKITDTIKGGVERWA